MFLHRYLYKIKIKAKYSYTIFPTRVMCIVNDVKLRSVCFFFMCVNNNHINLFILKWWLTIDIHRKFQYLFISRLFGELVPQSNIFHIVDFSIRVTQKCERASIFLPLYVQFKVHLQYSSECLSNSLQTFQSTVNLGEVDHRPHFFIFY